MTSADSIIMKLKDANRRASLSGIKRLIVIVVVLLVLVVIGVPAVLQALGRRVELGGTATVGNTPGNIYNGGYFCESDGKVYFSNLSDDGCLYVMNADETGYKKLSAMSLRNLMVSGRFIYSYLDKHTRGVSQGLGSVVSEYGIYRMRNDGKYAVCLLKEVAQSLQLCGSYVFYQKGNVMEGTLERIRVDKKDRSTFHNQHVNPAAYENGYIYYAGVTGDHSLYRISTESENPSPQRVFEGNVYQPLIMGSDVFYLDAVNGYRVCRFNVPSGQMQVLGTYGADCFNVNQSYIFYDSQDAPTPGLYRMRLDGTDNTLIMPGACNAIHLTSTHLYFKVHGMDGAWYHLPLSGSGSPSLFLPATS